MRKLTIYCLLLILATACYDDFDGSSTDRQTEEPDTFIDTDITGRAFDNNQLPLQSFTLSVENHQETTAQGWAYLPATNIRKFGQLVYFSGPNGENGFTNPLFIENDVNHVDLYAFPKTEQINLSSTSGIVELDGNVSIDMGNTDFETDNGDIYNGTILVNHFITSDVTLLNQVGHHVYDDQQLELCASKYFFYVQASDEDNNLLNFTAERSASIELDAGLQLYHLNTSASKWQRVESISQNGYYLIGSSLEGTFVEGRAEVEQRALAYADFNWSPKNISLRNHLRSTSKGNWLACMPTDQEIDFELLTPCDEIIESFSQSFEANSSGNLIKVNPSDRILKLVTEAFNCSGDLQDKPGIVVNGRSTAEASQFIFADQQINVWLPVCQDEILITAFDYLNNTIGPVLDWQTNFDDDLSILSSCDQYNSGFSYLKVRNDKALYASPEIVMDGSETFVNPLSDVLRLSFKGVNRGTYGETEVELYLSDLQFGSEGYRIDCEDDADGCGIFDFKVSHYFDGTENWFRVSFKGEIWAQTLNPPNAGDFDVEGVIMTKE